MSASIDINGKKLLSIKEVISKVDYSRDYVTRLARERKIVATQIGRKWYIDIESLKNYQQVVQAEQEIKKRQLSDERKRDLAIKEIKEAKRKVARNRVRRKLPAVALLCFIVGFGSVMGVFLESQTRANFSGITQLANIKTYALDNQKANVIDINDYVSGEKGIDFVSPDFTPTVIQKDLSSTEGLLLLPQNASGTVPAEGYFSDPVRLLVDKDGTRSVQRVDAEGQPVGKDIPFVVVPVNTNSP